jgi:hypothetical protein
MLINEAWRKTVEGILETGSRLIEAKEDLDPAEYEAMLQEDVAMSVGNASKLRIIASNPVLADFSHVKNLPASYGTLYELAKLPEETLLAGIADGVIHPKMERLEAVALLPNPSELRLPYNRNDHAAALTAELDEFNPEIRRSGQDPRVVQPLANDLVADLIGRINNILCKPVPAYTSRGKRKGRYRFSAPRRRYANLREKIEHVICMSEKLHSEFRDQLAIALRSLAKRASGLADDLAPVDANREEPKPVEEEIFADAALSRTKSGRKPHVRIVSRVSHRAKRIDGGAP